MYVQATGLGHQVAFVLGLATYENACVRNLMPVITDSDRPSIGVSRKPIFNIITDCTNHKKSKMLITFLIDFIGA